jgi:hypothetical protein
VEIRRNRRRRRGQPAAVEQPKPIVGAHSPGVRSRRQLVRRELDVNERIRLSLEARRGVGSGPTLWTFERR